MLPTKHSEEYDWYLRDCPFILSRSLDRYHLREIDQLIGDAIAYVERWWDSCDDDPVLRPLIS